MAIRRLPAVFMRGGTSKAVIFQQKDLPADRGAWDAIFLEVMGSPDPYGRQMDGMGGGLSSLSKICVVGPPSRADADVDYLFAQIPVNGTSVDYNGNCGNMSSAIGPFAIEAGLVAAPRDGEAAVRIHNGNTGKIIVSRFPVENGLLKPDGDLAIDGIAGTAAPIRLEFLEPGGAKTGRLLPTGSAIDRLDIDGLGSIEASCIDAANPAVFVAATDIGRTGAELPGDLEQMKDFLEIMDRIRLAASVRMGLAADLDAAARISAIPKVAMISAPQPMPTLSRQMLAASDMDIGIRMISVGQPHRAVPITGSICLAVATRVPGTIPHRLCAAGSGPIRISHPSGTILVDATVAAQPDGSMHAIQGSVYRTARRLFEGQVLYRANS